MTTRGTTGGDLAASSDTAVAGADRSARAWEAVRGREDLQFAPVPMPKVDPELPGWLRWLFEMLESIFGPVGRLFGMGWPVFRWVLLAAAILLLLWIVWRIAEPYITAWRSRRPAGGDAFEWTPTHEQARLLIEDADRLAGEGRYGEAAHLLLRRSVEQIGEARPRLLAPAATAREIAALELLPTSGRRAFGEIATRVERAIFALREIDAADWQAARDAYADFARLDLSA